MLCRGESLGVFQVESRAQMNMLPRLKPRKFYDLVIEVAIVRPGPIQGDMVHPYLSGGTASRKRIIHLRRPKHGNKDELDKVLHKTLGVPLFQEQAMRIAIEAAGFTPEEANGLRRAMATFRNVGTIGNFEEKMIGNMIRRGYDPEFAKNCFNQIKGFGCLRFSGKPCREFCAAGLYLVMAQALSSRRVLLRAVELAADGFLCPGADRRRCPHQQRRGARDRRVVQPRAEYAGAGRAANIAPCGSASARSTASNGPIRTRRG